MLTGRIVSSMTRSGIGRHSRPAGGAQRRAGDPRGAGPGDAHHGAPVRHGPDRSRKRSTGRRTSRQGYRHSFDMLGEAARTMADADRYFEAYAAPSMRSARRRTGRGRSSGPGISVKLSALHPRYEYGAARPGDAGTGAAAGVAGGPGESADIGLTVDAEEADRLDLSLDVIRRSVRTRRCAAGTGSASRCRPIRSARCRCSIGWPIWRAARAAADGAAGQGRLLGYARSNARRTPGWRTIRCSPARRRPMSPISPARKRLAATGGVLSAIRDPQRLFGRGRPGHHADSGGEFEFQRLHGMGAALYEQIVGPSAQDLPCRIYAPVGSHEDLLAYLVRRLLENGANTSFVNRIVDEDLPLEEIVADPVARTAALKTRRHRGDSGAGRSFRCRAAEFARV